MRRAIAPLIIVLVMAFPAIGYPESPAPTVQQVALFPEDYAGDSITVPYTTIGGFTHMELWLHEKNVGIPAMGFSFWSRQGEFVPAKLRVVVSPTLGKQLVPYAHRNAHITFRVMPLAGLLTPFRDVRQAENWDWKWLVERVVVLSKKGTQETTFEEEAFGPLYTAYETNLQKWGQRQQTWETTMKKEWRNMLAVLEDRAQTRQAKGKEASTLKMLVAKIHDMRLALPQMEAAQAERHIQDLGQQLDALEEQISARVRQEYQARYPHLDPSVAKLSIPDVTPVESTKSRMALQRDKMSDVMTQLLGEVKVPTLKAPPSTPRSQESGSSSSPSTKRAQSEIDQRIDAVMEQPIAQSAPTSTPPASPSQPAQPSSGKNRYLAMVEEAIDHQWEAPPLVASTPMVVLKFRIAQSGEISNIHIEESSGNGHYDSAAKRAVYAVNPLPPFPEEITDTYFDVRFRFVKE